jgi:hypothetical protein
MLNKCVALFLIHSICEQVTNRYETFGVFFPVEGSQGKNTFSKTVQRQVWHEDISRR